MTDDLKPQQQTTNMSVIKWLRTHPHEAMLIVPAAVTALVCSVAWLLVYLI